MINKNNEVQNELKSGVNQNPATELNKVDWKKIMKQYANHQMAYCKSCKNDKVCSVITDLENYDQLNDGVVKWTAKEKWDKKVSLGLRERKEGIKMLDLNELLSQAKKDNDKLAQRVILDEIYDDEW